MTDKLTKDEVNEIFKDLPLLFRSYYKYTFYFDISGANGYTACVGYGGNSDDIYRYEVCDGVNGEFLGVSDWNFVTVYLNSEQVYNYYNY